MNMMVCEPVSSCGCPPGHWCWFCLKDTQAEVLADLLLNHPDLVDALNQVRMGVTNGTPAVSGQVGEWIGGSQVVGIPALASTEIFQTTALPLVIPPGDWMCFADAYWDEFYPAVAFGVQAMPAGLDNAMYGGLWGSADPNARMAVGVPGHALLSAPGALGFAIQVTAGAAAAAGLFTMHLQAYRIR